MYFFYNFTILLFIFLVLICYNHQQILANQSKEVNKRSIVRTVIKGSGHPVPRFLSLKSNDVNMRKGPGKEYPIKFKYIKKGYPLKIVAEYHHWRKVIDHEKNTGWIRGTLLSGKRFALILDAFVKLRKKNNQNSTVIALAEKNVLMELQYCIKDWCKLSLNNVRGWTKKEKIWGILPDEVLKK